MKRTNLFYRIITLSLLLIAISSIWTPCSANAAEQSHDISVTLTFFDEEATDSTLEDYQANTFRLQRGMDGTYVTAVYDTVSRCYIFTGYTFHESCATEFFCGMDSDRPELLTIKGLPTGSYSLRQFQTTVGYMLLRDPVSIGISDTGTTVNGEPVTPDTDNTAHFTIVMTHGYDMPGTCHWCSMIRSLKKGYELPLMSVITAFSIFAFFGILWIEKEAGVSILRTWRCGITVATCVETLLLCLYKKGVLEGNIDFLTAATYYGVLIVLLATSIIHAAAFVCLLRLKKEI